MKKTLCTEILLDTGSVLQRRLYAGSVILILFISTFAFSKNAHAYDDLRNTLDYMFAKIDRNVVPTGYLIDYAIEYEDLTNIAVEKIHLQCNVILLHMRK